VFAYHRAESLEEAVELLGNHEDAKLLAGGHSLLPMMKLRLAQPAVLVDISRLPLAGIDITSQGLVVGALATHRSVGTSATVASRWKVFAEAAASIGDPIVRNRGTVGGNIAHADPASDLPAALLALEGDLGAIGANGRRRMPADRFFQGLLTTALEPTEVLTDLRLPTPGPRTGSAYLKFDHPASGFAVCGAAAVIELDSDGNCKRARLCFNGITDVPFDATSISDVLAGVELSNKVIEQAVSDCLVVEEPLSDTFASGEYRKQLARVYACRSLRVACDRARAGRDGG
jgi:carbon-monoxide dehydrogenase medium subunit